MPSYEYRAKDGPEKVIQGVIEASNEASAIEKLAGLGYVPVAVNLLVPEQKAEPLAILFRSKRKTRRQVMFFSRHLSSLLKSGVPILRGLSILSDQEKDPVFRGFLSSLTTQIRQGASLSQAMRQFSGLFSPMYTAIVSAGEAGGALPESLLRMAGYLKKEEELRSKINRAMAYPVLLAVAGLGTVFFILTFVVPKLTRLFLNLGQQLPLPTRIIMVMGDFMNRAWFYLIPALAAVLLLARWLNSKQQARGFFDYMALRMPFWGNLLFKAEIARFGRTIEISLSNGIPFLDCLRLAIPTLSNGVLRDVIETAYQRVQTGESFGQCLRQSGLFPHFVSDLILIGEESGRLEEVLLEIAETYEDETDQLLLMLTTLLEPAMILIVGSIVGFIVIAMLLPIFEMNVVF